LLVLLVLLVLLPSAAREGKGEQPKP
jgi:hypothetical protein